MAAYRRVYDSRHLQADCQEPGSAPKPYAWQSSMGYLYLFYCSLIAARSGALGGIRGYTNLRGFLTAILTSVIINKQGTFRPFATPLCVYPPSFLAIHHWLHAFLATRLLIQSWCDITGNRVGTVIERWRWDELFYQANFMSEYCWAAIITYGEKFKKDTESRTQWTITYKILSK